MDSISAEDVRRAGNEISSAAESMRQTAVHLDESLRRSMNEFTYSLPALKRQAELNARVACAQIAAAAMTAENMQRAALGQSMAYDDAAFCSLIERHRIGEGA